MRYLLLLMSIFLCGMSRSYPSSYYEVMAVINQYSKELNKEGLEMRWYGLDYATPDKIQIISLGYSIDQNLSMKEARQFFYRIVDGLLKELNENEQIRAHFTHHPLTYADLHFVVGFDYENKGHLRKDDMHQMSLRFNEIFYSITNVDGATNKLVLNETHSGLGTLSYSGEDSFRTFIRKLPETE